MKDEPTPEDVEKVQRYLDAEDERQAALEQLEYDGVQGIPPDWVPAPIIEKFRQARDRVLFDWGYTHEQALEWINRYCRIAQDDDDWFYPGYYPCGRELNSSRFLEVFGLLAHIRWAVSLGPDEGVKELAGDDARLGYVRRRQLSDFGKRSREFYDNRPAEWKRWRAEADRVAIEYPRLAGNKSELARRVKRNLGLSESIRTIRHRI